MIERRLTVLAAIFVLWGGAIFAKLLSLQVLHHREYVELARNREELDVAIPAPRGTIFDRHGQPMAMSVPTESVYVNPLKVPDLDVAATILSLALHLDRNDLYEKMKSASDAERGFLWVKRKITFEEGQSARNLRLDWIQIQSESQRHYPNGALGAALLGSVDFEEKGNAGVERSFDNELRGKPGRVRLLTDVNRRGIDSQMEMSPRDGTPLTLTIDEHLQFVAEREIAVAVTEHAAVSGSVVVMNPQNGEILALASYPPYDPNEPPRPRENQARQNHALSVPFEPGSVFKV
ncbi:MAG TPA: penicillin-binding transpeptidase domain-containing protein, partial [Candidatus Acidoferrales bacterium]|nr:penicillin-binding transpeptidase domain-containing protein [Candidatus Acidoferrales bacterium]